MMDMANNVKIVRVISPISVGDDTDQVGEVVDRAGFESLTYFLAAGTLAAAAGTFDALLEESDTGAFGGEENNVADGDLIGLEAGASFDQDDDDGVWKLGYIGNKQHTRLSIIITTNDAAAPIAAIAVLGKAHDRPVA